MPFFFLWLLSSEVEIVEDGLPQPCIVVAFDGVGEVGFEEFVALEEVANDWYFGLYNSVETFWPVLEYLFPCFHGELQFLVYNVGPLIISAFNGVSSYPAHP